LNHQQMITALKDLGIAKFVRGSVAKPLSWKPHQRSRSSIMHLPSISKNETISTRQAFGRALVRLAPKFPKLVVLDGEVKNSTFTEYFADAYPSRFFQSYIAEQHM